MSGNALRAGTLAGASEFEMHFRNPTLGDDTRLAIKIFFGSVLAALFFIWLASPYARLPAGWGPRQALECTSLGRGGDYCVEKPAGSSQPNVAGDRDGACNSIGRAGRVCFGPRG